MNFSFGRGVLRAAAGESGGGAAGPVTPTGPSTAPAAPSGGPPSGGAPAAAPSSAPKSFGDKPATPAATPTPGPAAPTTEGRPVVPEELPPPTPGSDLLDFESIFGPAPSSEAPAPVVAPVAPAVPEPVAPQPAAPAPPAPVQPEVPATPPGPQAATPGQQPESPRLDAADPYSLVQHLEANEQVVTDHVADTLFRLTPEEVEALETNAVAAVPKLFAKAFVTTQKNMLTQLGRLIPQMLQRHGEMVRRNATNEGKFYQRWPQLNAETHGQTVRSYAATYRAMHPHVSLEQMIEAIGPMVMMAANVQPGAPANGGGPASPMAPAPAGPNGRPPQPPPFVPAQGGPAAPSTQVEPEAWEAMFLGDR